jgi:hypothetical protein
MTTNFVASTIDVGAKEHWCGRARLGVLAIQAGLHRLRFVSFFRNALTQVWDQLYHQSLLTFRYFV